VREATVELKNSRFNGWGFVSNADLVSGHSGSPLVDIKRGEVVGIHRAGPSDSGSYFSERRIHVDIRRVRKQLLKLGIPMGPSIDPKESNGTF
jgi:V8-like Glu-specific endopeptidase